MSQKRRCQWAGSDPLYQAYHDQEWGVPVYDDRRLFEALVLDGAQAGLSWITILRKRENYRRAFDNFDAEKIACYDSAKIERLLVDPGIVRNRLKVMSAIGNARAFLALREECNSFSGYLWQFVEGRPVDNRWPQASQVPTVTPQAEVMSRDLKHRGFSFVGPTICYAFMQAVGMVNDHTLDCFRHREILESRHKPL